MMLYSIKALHLLLLAVYLICIPHYHTKKSGEKQFVQINSYAHRPEKETKLFVKKRVNATQLKIFYS